jgi:hypothetical protein
VVFCTQTPQPTPNLLSSEHAVMCIIHSKLSAVVVALATREVSNTLQLKHRDSRSVAIGDVVNTIATMTLTGGDCVRSMQRLSHKALEQRVAAIFRRMMILFLDQYPAANVAYGKLPGWTAGKSRHTGIYGTVCAMQSLTEFVHRCIRQLQCGDSTTVSEWLQSRQSRRNAHNRQRVQ